MPSAGADHLGAAAPPVELATLGLDLRLLGFGRLESVLAAASCALAVRAACSRCVVGGLGHMAGGAQGLGALEGVRALDHARLGLHDGAAGLGDGGGGAGKAGVVLGDLRIERIGDQASQHVALLHAHALVGQHLGDAQAFDLGSDQDLLARYQRAGGEHRLHEVGRATRATVTAAARAHRRSRRRRR